jgi:hypothetical protein
MNNVIQIKDVFNLHCHGGLSVLNVIGNLSVLFT